MHSLILGILIIYFLCVLVPQQVRKTPLTLSFCSIPWTSSNTGCRSTSWMLLLVLLILRLLVFLDSGCIVLGSSTSHRVRRPTTVTAHGYSSLCSRSLGVKACIWRVQGVYLSALQNLRLNVLHDHWVLAAEGHRHGCCHLRLIAIGYLKNKNIH